MRHALPPVMPFLRLLSPNAACEGFFGRMKLEMFYGRDWSRASLDDFMKAIDEYLDWFRNGRIKTALGNLTPMEYRQRAGFAA